MPQRPLPHYIDPVKLVEQKSILSGQLHLGDMPRLSACVVSHEQGQADIGQNTLALELEFYRDEQGLRVMKGRAKGQVSLVCQRCLGERVFQLDVPIMLAVVKNDKAVAELPSRYEPLLVNDGPVSLISLVEDELLLALPNIAYHDEGECSVMEYQTGEAEAAEAESGKPNPFDILAGLKKK